MDISSKQLSDGRFEITLTGTIDEMREEFGPEDADDESESAGLLRKDYCCRCSAGGDRHTIRASNSFSAASKCLGRCAGPFSLSGGACR